MKRPVLLALCIPFMFSASAYASDFKQEASQIAKSYEACYTKQDPACVAALYTKDGVFINATGMQDVATAYAGTFKAGFNKLDATVDEVWQVDNDTPAAMGKFHITGKNDKGDALDASGTWSAVYVKSDDKWKIRMLTASPAPPKKD
ncbi:nuclear transport factor 2 family protein [Bradyrhizobium sp. CB2312]|uniref:nuclear transport factor 2 family protein n=1 Tax=Bradyrhizobium sp. CB2312 TaxID=3039155 RepID=UPI0024B17C96|nr:nuclear transport factor 2 family protein [Bradyrhizobium sp. CB2312]WFU74846.1 nuclear transport factor 2 family protein [Bradyrhizobium sp. CB2312]